VQAAERTLEAVSSARGGFKYEWQEPPLFKAVLEARVDELREAGLSVWDGSMAEWHALVSGVYCFLFFLSVVETGVGLWSGLHVLVRAAFCRVF
jgi:hypothetical protein